MVTPCAVLGTSMACCALVWEWVDPLDDWGKGNNRRASREPRRGWQHLPGARAGTPPCAVQHLVILPFWIMAAIWFRGSVRARQTGSRCTKKRDVCIAACTRDAGAQAQGASRPEKDCHGRAQPNGTDGQLVDIHIQGRRLTTCIQSVWSRGRGGRRSSEKSGHSRVQEICVLPINPKSNTSAFEDNPIAIVISFFLRRQTTCASEDKS
eukprot:1161135-Pelagomonas_calceolata.AAC.9